MPHLPVYYAAQSSALKNKQGGALGAVITEMDEGLAAIWKVLEEKGLADNTILFSQVIMEWTNFPERMEEMV